MKNNLLLDTRCPGVQLNSYIHEPGDAIINIGSAASGSNS